MMLILFVLTVGNLYENLWLTWHGDLSGAQKVSVQIPARSKSPKGQDQNHQKVKNKFLEKLIFSSWGIGMAGIDAAVKPIARKVRKTWKIRFGFVTIVIVVLWLFSNVIVFVVLPLLSLLWPRSLWLLLLKTHRGADCHPRHHWARVALWIIEREQERQIIFWRIKDIHLCFPFSWVKCFELRFLYC